MVLVSAVIYRISLRRKKKEGRQGVSPTGLTAVTQAAATFCPLRCNHNFVILSLDVLFDFIFDIYLPLTCLCRQRTRAELMSEVSYFCLRYRSDTECVSCAKSLLTQFGTLMGCSLFIFKHKNGF